MGSSVGKLWGATTETLTAALQALIATPTTLGMLNLSRSQFSLEAMQALCSVLLRHSKSMTSLLLDKCNISDDGAHLLATVVHRLKGLERFELNNNDIHDSAIGIAEAVLGLPELRVVKMLGNPISASVREALDKMTGHILRHENRNRWGVGLIMGGGIENWKVFYY